LIAFGIVTRAVHS